VGACGASKCANDPCQGEYCNPVTGACGAFPCEGVKCPSGQVCENGECVLFTPSNQPDAGPKGHDGGPVVGAGGGGGGPITTHVTPKSAFGLATGGGGCSCSVPGKSESSPRSALLAGLALSISLMGRRRARRDAKGGAR
jgi:MYXO-CTERM domain-containing protein